MNQLVEGLKKVTEAAGYFRRYTSDTPGVNPATGCKRMILSPKEAIMFSAATITLNGGNDTMGYWDDLMKQNGMPELKVKDIVRFDKDREIGTEYALVLGDTITYFYKDSHTIAGWDRLKDVTEDIIAVYRQKDDLGVGWEFIEKIEGGREKPIWEPKKEKQMTVAEIEAALKKAGKLADGATLKIVKG